MQICGGIFVIIAILAPALTLLFAILRFLIVLFFFARYSLRQMLVSIIILNVLLVLIVSLDAPWKAFPYLALAGFILVVVFYILDQDPEGVGHTPDFLREYLNRKQQSPNPAPAPPDHPSQSTPPDAEKKD